MAGTQVGYKLGKWQEMPASWYELLFVIKYMSPNSSFNILKVTSLQREAHEAVERNIMATRAFMSCIQSC